MGEGIDAEFYFFRSCEGESLICCIDATRREEADDGDETGSTVKRGSQGHLTCHQSCLSLWFWKEHSAQSVAIILFLPLICSIILGHVLACTKGNRRPSKAHRRGILLNLSLTFIFISCHSSYFFHVLLRIVWCP